MLFSDMPYVRPDMDLLREKIEEHTEELKNAQSFAEADRAYAALEKAFSGVQTAMTLCYIRHTVNTEDEFYAAEQECLDEIRPQLQQIQQGAVNTEDEFYAAEQECLDEIRPQLQQIQQGAQMELFRSAWRPDFERKYGSLLFTNMTIELRSFDPKLIPDMQEENKLVTAYGKLIASAQIPFEGQVLNLAQLGPYKESPDPAMRRKAWLAQAGFYTEHQQELDDIYDKLTALRTKMGRAMGYENFVPLGYDRMCRNCYTEADVKKFREAIVEYVVPVADRLYREQAQRLGVSYPLSYADTAPMFLTGNPKPQGTADDILAAGKKFYHELSPEASTFIDVMFKNELMDVLSRKGKPLHLRQLQRHPGGRGGADPRGRPRLRRLHRPGRVPPGAPEPHAGELRDPLHEHGVLRLALGRGLLRRSGGQVPLFPSGGGPHVPALRHHGGPLPAHRLRAAGADSRSAP